MKPNKFFKITSLFLALMIFVSSLGYSLDIHYCGDRLHDFSFLGDVSSCQKADQSNSYQVKFKKKGCCGFDHFKVETSSQFQLSSYDIDQTVLDGLTFSLLCCQLFYIENTKEILHKTLNLPPILCTNKVYKKCESFLI